MKLKMVTGAVFRLNNIGVLLAAFGGAIIFNTLVPGMNVISYSTAAALYVLAVILSFSSKKFQEEFTHKQKMNLLRGLDRESKRLFRDARRYLNQPYFQKLKKVIDCKEDIVNSFIRGEKDYIKEKILEQTLKLVVAYQKLLINYCIRTKGLKNTDVSEIAERINMNRRKLSFAKDIFAADDIKKIIEIDEKQITSLKEEKADLERIGAKLDYMEGIVNMFKRQILSSIESQEMLDKLETAVDEATALDSVLQERRRGRLQH